MLSFMIYAIYDCTMNLIILVYGRHLPLFFHTYICIYKKDIYNLGYYGGAKILMMIIA